MLFVRIQKTNTKIKHTYTHTPRTAIGHLGENETSKIPIQELWLVLLDFFASKEFFRTNFSFCVCVCRFTSNRFIKMGRMEQNNPFASAARKLFVLKNSILWNKNGGLNHGALYLCHLYRIAFIYILSLFQIGPFAILDNYFVSVSFSLSLSLSTKAFLWLFKWSQRRRYSVCLLCACA